MSAVSSFDLLEGEDEHVSAHDQAGRPLPATEIAWSMDPVLQNNVTVTSDPTGYVVHAINAANGNLTLTATRGAQSVVKTFPVVITARLNDVVLETP